MRLRFVVLGLLVLAAVLAWGQVRTVLPWMQIAWPAATVDRVLVLAADGIHFVDLGANLSFDKSVTPWRLVASTGAAPLPIVVEKLARNVDGTWQLSRAASGSVLITRNGLVMMPGIDYTMVGQIVTFTAAQGSLATDIVGAVYQ